MVCKWLLLLLFIRWLLNVIIHSFLGVFSICTAHSICSFWWSLSESIVTYFLDFQNVRCSIPFIILIRSHIHWALSIAWIQYSTKTNNILLLFLIYVHITYLLWFRTSRVEHFNFRSSHLLNSFLSASSASLKYIENAMDEDVPGQKRNKMPKDELMVRTIELSLFLRHEIHSFYINNFVFHSLSIWILIHAYELGILKKWIKNFSSANDSNNIL